MRRVNPLVACLATLLGFAHPSYADATDTKIQLDGLWQHASITRDDVGIAHIKANNAHDVFFLQGWVHAQDRLFQMDLNRRQASGSLAELFGPTALPGDVQARTIGLRRAAERSLPLLSPVAQDMIEAYTEGVNAYAAQHALPPEYAALEITQFKPWTTIDVLAVSKLISFGLAFTDTDIANTKALVAAMTALGPEAGRALFFEDIWRSQSFDSASTVPDAKLQLDSGEHSEPHHDHHAHPDIAPGLIKKGQSFFERLRKDKHHGWAFDKHPKGSNQWAISGQFTENGLPLLANDPHLTLTNPSVFYPIHLTAPRLNVIGNGFPGAPAVITGHNRHIAWAPTVNPMDVTDFYAETLVPDGSSPSGLSTRYLGALEHVIPLPEQFYFNQPGNGTADDLALANPAAHGVPAATLIVPRRNQGPLLAVETTPTGLQGLSLQYTGASGTRELETFLTWNYARNLHDFRRGLETFDFGSQNWAYIDRRGNIAYFTSAEMPIREDLQANTINGLPPYFIRNGEGGNEWLPVTNPQPGQALPYEILPADEMPHIINPPAGWFINANNDPAGNTRDNNPLNQFRPGGGLFYLNPFYKSLRAGRLTQLLQNKLTHGHKVSREDMQAMQADVVSIDAQLLTPYLLTAMENARATDAHPALAALSEDTALVEAIGRLQHWQFNSPTGIAAGYDSSDEPGELAVPSAQEINDSIAATLYSAWRSRIVANTLDRALESLGLAAFQPEDTQTIAALRHLLDSFPVQQGIGLSGVNFFAAGGTGDAEADRDIVLLQSLKDALAMLASDAFRPAFAGSSNQDDYRWGMLHRVALAHPLGAPFSVPPAGGAFPAPLEGLGGIPVDGGFGSPDAAFHPIRATSPDDFMFPAGPATRLVVQMTPRGPRAEAIWPGGISGVLGSPNYTNFLLGWLTNQTVPLHFKRRDVKQHRTQTQRFHPTEH